MKNILNAKTMMAVVLGTLLTAGNALAEDTLGQKVQQAATTTGAKIDSSLQKASGYMDDSTITAKMKSALMDDKAIESGDISVSTTKGVVTLTGFVPSQAVAAQAVAVATKTESVQSVSDKLQIKDNATQSLGSYTDDAVITSSIKAKLLADKIVPSRHVKVETQEGVVQLSGNVKNTAQSARAESIAKAVSGVKSVKNDLTVTH
ncbi:molecular chaperone OsmY [Candidatus Symbiopectobacterium sp. 'North America']|uniref:molecular chaperone OsmY n=1 Tax=Candidatus Symbiopectobacterium sp. 'North America' TaxID=2794574 RepID=UPI0018C930BA|nr:molecular chaperone OsmY [Candidatus Symbiopectobacterium sp. 'North America']MBG6244602.1 molecular chaperone OsmY [Candidatus Symbiopectobacterium sp. 'North America']